MRCIKKLEPIVPKLPAKKCVAAYCRVSSGKDAMLHSLSAQVSYYSEYIQRNSEWQYMGVYVDEATSGTKDTRPQFQRLLTDCRAGHIDIIITKSISRFARNTVTMLETVRELKSIGVEVYFEKENISSFSGDGEVMLTILASFAQEESRSVSENCKWRLRDKMKNGKLHSIQIFGYYLVDGTLRIEPSEAKIVKMIFDDYLSGMGKNLILKKLMVGNYPTKRGGQWNESAIGHILRNEKYTGDMLLQKTFVSDHISKKKCFNNGELPKFYVADSHEPIIDKATFEEVQAELKRRSEKHKPNILTRKEYPFTGKIICDICGKHYRRKISNAGSKYEKAVWICSTFNKLGKSVCPSQQIPEEILLKLVPPDFLEIHIPKHGIISIVLRNGTTIEKTWQNKSRAESWTDEMKIKAREKNFERRKN